MTLDLHHFYHCYADGKWQQPVDEHLVALRVSGLADHLTTFRVGLVGTATNMAKAIAYLSRRCRELGITYSVATVEEQGWEQVTLNCLYEFSQTHDGAVLYAHTKGASRTDPIDEPWRRSMTQLCVVDWRVAVAALECDGKFIVGCHWIRGNPDIERLNDAWINRALNPPGLDGVGGMFGGNFWWTRLELLRQNCPPDNSHRFAAEHWLGQLSEVMPINATTILDLNPFPIVPQNLVPLRLD